jgi:hypothetical protein
VCTASTFRHMTSANGLPRHACAVTGFAVVALTGRSRSACETDRAPESVFARDILAAGALSEYHFAQRGASDRNPEDQARPSAHRHARSL